MRTRLVAKLLAIVVGLTGGLLALPTASYAASGLTTTTGWWAGDDSFTSEVDADWRIGDCTLIQALNPWYSYVRLTPPDSSGNATITMGGVAVTRHTNNADVWWTTFTFITAFNTTVAVSPVLRGVDMRVVGEYYEWSLTVPMTIDPALYHAITQVRWSSSC